MASGTARRRIWRHRRGGMQAPLALILQQSMWLRTSYMIQTRMARAVLAGRAAQRTVPAQPLPP
eukprot:6949912-Alexandrium_andersonii.AAC.1